MPRSKPKRFHKNRKKIVVRRKRKIKNRVKGTGRNRKRRPKHKNEQKGIEKSV